MGIFSETLLPQQFKNFIKKITDAKFRSSVTPNSFETLQIPTIKNDEFQQFLNKVLESLQLLEMVSAESHFYKYALKYESFYEKSIERSTKIIPEGLSKGKELSSIILELLKVNRGIFIGAQHDKSGADLYRNLSKNMARLKDQGVSTICVEMPTKLKIEFDAFNKSTAEGGGKLGYLVFLNNLSEDIKRVLLF